MSEFINERHVFANMPETSRLDVLHAIAERALELGITDDSESCYQAFLWREQEGETGMENGFAIPHAKAAAIKHAAVIVYRTRKAIEWPSLDGKPVDVSIALLVPEAEAGTTHLKLLSNTAMLLMEPGFQEMIRKSDNPVAIAEYIGKGVNEHEDDIDDEGDE